MKTADSSVGVPKILVVDDQKLNRLLLSEILRKEGYGVLEAQDGAEARELARREKPDLILLDVLMPQENGFETCERLKRDPLTSEIPVLFVSAADDTETKVRGLTLGAVDYIPRSFHRDEVAARVRIHLRLAQAERERVSAQAGRILQEAATAQSSILVDPRRSPEAKFVVRRRAVDQAGGDFYDVFPLGEGIHGYLVADASGHGLSASYTTPMLKALVAQNASPVNTPVQLFRTMNTVLHRILRDGQHATACMVKLNRATRSVEALSAGHPFPVLLPAQGEPRPLGAPGNPLGAFEHAVLESTSALVGDGDRLFLFTDGLLECAGGGLGSRREGEARFMALLPALRGGSLDAMTEALFREMTGGRDDLADDVLLMGIEV